MNTNFEITISRDDCDSPEFAIALNAIETEIKSRIDARDIAPEIRDELIMMIQDIHESIFDYFDEFIDANEIESMIDSEIDEIRDEMQMRKDACE